MMTLIYNYVALCARYVIDHSSPIQALNHAYVQFAVRGGFPSANLSYGFRSPWIHFLTRLIIALTIIHYHPQGALILYNTI